MTESIVKKKSFEFALKIICLYRQLTKNGEFVISKQLLKCGTSIGANIEEALAGQSRKDFLSKMSIASKEARETRYWLHLLKESNLTSLDPSDLFQPIEELIRMLTSIVKTTVETRDLNPNSKLKTQHSKLGFTLIELLVVVVILGVLMGLAVPRLAGRTEEARIQAARADIVGGIALALDLFEVDTGRYPESLDVLVKKPQDSSVWKGPYLKRGIPKDPWGNPYQYRFPGTQNPESYDLLSMGPDKKEGTGDEITNANV